MNLAQNVNFHLYQSFRDLFLEENIKVKLLYCVLFQNMYFAVKSSLSASVLFVKHNCNG